MKIWLKVLTSLLLTAGQFAAQAQSSCSSDRVSAPGALLERFINADCSACWIATDTPKAAPGDLALDWVVPGSKGDDAPMSAVASNDALLRLEALHLPVPGSSALAPRKVRMGRQRLRVAHGQPYNDYVGVSIELQPTTPGPWTAWLALVETLPAGAEGSPVERNLVRNVLQVEWKQSAGSKTKLSESRSMFFPPAANAERMRVAGWMQDGSGRMIGMAVSRCAPSAPDAAEKK
jgi:hypothetical protein